MRFVTQRDYDTLLAINKELINEVMDLNVIIYKINIPQSKTNSYGEAPKKTWNVGIIVPCLPNIQEKSVNTDAVTPDVTQEVEFSFLRVECEQRNIYPQAGDIIEWNNSYYEINNTNEVQFVSGRPNYNHAIVCSTHLSRSMTHQLVRPPV